MDEAYFSGNLHLNTYLYEIRNLKIQFKTLQGNNEEAFTPLSFASFHKNAEVVKLLESEYQKVQNEKPLDGAVLKDYVTTPLKKPKYNLAEIEAVKCATPIGKIVKDGITHVSTSALSVKSKSLCETFSKKFKIKINPNYDDSCDALIVSKKSEPNMYSRTIKVVTALMRNGVLVDDSWIQDSLDNGKLLSYEKYLVDSFCEHKVNSTARIFFSFHLFHLYFRSKLRKNVSTIN